MFIKMHRPPADNIATYYAIYNDQLSSLNIMVFADRAERDAVYDRLTSTGIWADEATSPHRTRSLDAYWETPWLRETPEDAPDVDPAQESANLVPVEELERANARLAQVQAELVVANAEITDTNDPRLGPIWEKAAQAAEENDFCGEYERLAASLGIPGRPKLRRGVVNVTFNVYAYATSTDDDEAGEAMEELVLDRLREYMTTGDYGEEGAVTHLDIDRSDYESVQIYN